MNDLKQILVDDARSAGICEEGYYIMRTRNIDGLIAYYLQNPDWCMERNFPDLETLSTEFGDIQDRGVYINTQFNGEMLDDLQTYIFHNCTGRIRVRLNTERKLIPMLYFANNCDMVIECDDNISVPLYIFGKNTIVTNNSSAFKFFKHPLLLTK